MGLFDIYSKEDWRTIMAKEKEIRLEKVLQDMSFSLKHIEDIMADDRQLLVKLVKQNNTIVDYLKQLEIDIVEEYENGIVPELSEEEQQRIKKAKELKEVLNEFMDKRKDLKEFEKELKKNKDMLTPGQVGDA
jgi:DNA-binding transcriptional MerR regulator